jgi:hypothetical protein
MNDKGVTISNEELAILCDIVSGKNRKRDENLTADKILALDHLIAEGFVEPMEHYSHTKYHHTGKTEALFAQLCTGVSGAYA